MYRKKAAKNDSIKNVYKNNNNVVLINICTYLHLTCGCFEYKSPKSPRTNREGIKTVMP